MSNFKWYEYSGEAWSIESSSSFTTNNILESEKPKPVVVYNAEGQPLTKPVQRMGFDLTPDKK